HAREQLSPRNQRELARPAHTSWTRARTSAANPEPYERGCSSGGRLRRTPAAREGAASAAVTDQARRYAARCPGAAAVARSAGGSSLCGWTDQARRYAARCPGAAAVARSAGG